MSSSSTSTTRLSAYDLPLADWSSLLHSLGLPAFRASQVRRWLYKPVLGFHEMSDLPQDLRTTLATSYRGLHETAALEDQAHTSENGTQKLLFRLADNHLVESVLIPARDRLTLCLSSQVGCGFHCAFCASGALGFTRNLSRGEILAQALHCTLIHGKRPDNIVFMGIGEPFANYDEVLAAIRVLNDPNALGIGARRITLSTCGVVPGIQRLASEGLQIELSVSLHAPTDAQRSELMPVNRTYPIRELLDACDAYTQATDRIVTFEYTLVQHFNDSPRDARTLIALLRGHKCRVNLIPLNPTEHFPGKRPPDSTLYGFRDALLCAHINTTLRLSRGATIDAACGQLRLRRISKP